MTIAPEGRRMLRVEARNAETPIERKPAWIRTTAKMGPAFTELHSMVKGEGLHQPDFCIRQRIHVPANIYHLTRKNARRLISIS